LKLVLPSPDFKAAYIDFVEEFERFGEYRPLDELEFCPREFPAYIQRLNDFALGMGVNPGFVPWTHLLAGLAGMQDHWSKHLPPFS